MENIKKLIKFNHPTYKDIPDDILDIYIENSLELTIDYSRVKDENELISMYGRGTINGIITDLVLFELGQRGKSGIKSANTGETSVSYIDNARKEILKRISPKMIFYKG